MTFYDKRRQELIDSLNNTSAAREPPTDDEKRLMMAAVQEWGTRRSEHLDALLKILADQTKDPLVDTWKRRVSSLRDDLATFCKTDQKLRQPVTPWALEFLSGNGRAETAFVNAVDAALRAAEARDHLANYTNVVGEHSKNLETKWEALLASHRSAELNELEVMAQLSRLIDDTCTKTRQLHEQAVGLLSDGVKATKNILESSSEGQSEPLRIPTPAEKGIVVLGYGLEAFTSLKTGILDQEARFRSYFREELGGPLLLFDDFRDDTDEFIHKFGYEEAVKVHDEGRAKLDDLVSNGNNSSANGADAETFVTAAKILLQGHLNNAKRVWDDFVEKHKGKFFGPVAPRFEKALLDRDLFEEKYERLAADSLNELVKMWRSREAFGVDLSGLPPSVAKWYQEEMGKKLLDIDAILKDPLLDRFGDAVKTVIENAHGKISY